MLTRPKNVFNKHEVLIMTATDEEKEEAVREATIPDYQSEKVKAERKERFDRKQRVYKMEVAATRPEILQSIIKSLAGYKSGLVEAFSDAGYETRSKLSYETHKREVGGEVYSDHISVRVESTVSAHFILVRIYIKEKAIISFTNYLMPDGEKGVRIWIKVVEETADLIRSSELFKREVRSWDTSGEGCMGSTLEVLFEPLHDIYFTSVDFEEDYE